MNAFGIIFSDAYSGERIGELTAKRNLASTPFGGRYRLIDFMMSSFVNANMHNIGVVTRNNYGSLVDHLGSGKDWDLNRKNGGLKILTPFVEANGKNINSKMDALASVKTYIKHSLEEYCVLAEGNIVSNIDFNSVIKTHIEKNADITCLYRETTVRAGEMSIKTESNGHICDVLYHTDDVQQTKDVIMKVYVMKKSFLLELIDKGITFGWDTIDKDFISKNFKDYSIYAYKITGYCSVIRDVNEYYYANKDLFDKNIRNELFRVDRPILTKVKDSVPTMYEDNCKISGSLVADGCILDGIVENSILFRGAVVKKGAVVKNSIIMQNTVIGENCVLSNIIADKNVSISSDKVLTGYESLPFVISKGTKI